MELVRRGYGATIALVVIRGYASGSAPAPDTDAYAARGWAPRTFYTPYWMGMVPSHEIHRLAAERAKEKRIEYGIIEPDIQAIIEPIAQAQQDNDVDEVVSLGELLATMEAKQIAWSDHFGGYLSALKAELEEVKQSRQRAQEIRNYKTDQRDQLIQQAQQEVERRTLEDARKKRNNLARVLLTNDVDEVAALGEYLAMMAVKRIEWRNRFGVYLSAIVAELDETLRGMNQPRK